MLLVAQASQGFGHPLELGFLVLDALGKRLFQ